MTPLTALIIGYVWPETNASAAGLRDWALMEHFRQAGWAVAYASPAKENLFSKKITDLGVPIFSCQANDSRFDSFIRELRPDVVVFDRFIIEEQFGWRVQENAPEALRVVDTQDLHSLRRAREAALPALGHPLPKADLDFLRTYANEDFLRELSSILRSDQALVISSFERDLLVSLGIPEESLTLLRFSYSDLLEGSPSFEQRRHFVTIGNFRHPPNADSIRWLHDSIWPELKSLVDPGTELHIYGAYPPKDLMSLDSPESGFRVKGPAPDQYETLKKYRVLLAPLRFGAGIKGKISDAWRSGTPVVSTSIGAEGMSLRSFAGICEDQENSFARSAQALYKDADNNWSRLQSEGYAALRAEYLFSKNHALLISRILELKKTQTERRTKNWMGALLHLNLHRSTKYFSKWIEEKNKPENCK